MTAEARMLRKLLLTMAGIETRDERDGPGWQIVARLHQPWH
jgi:hypothetical protein